MLLERQDCQQFFKLHRALMFFVNQRLRVIAEQVASPDEFSSLPPATRLKVQTCGLKPPTTLPQSICDKALACRGFPGGFLFQFNLLNQGQLFLQGFPGRHRAGVGVETEQIPLFRFVTLLSHVPTVAFIFLERE